MPHLLMATSKWGTLAKVDFGGSGGTGDHLRSADAYT
jgi:hypothetical protein